MTKSRITTMLLQACNMVLPIAIFIQLSTHDPTLAIKLEVFLALLSTFSMLAGFGAQSIIPQQLRFMLKKGELLSYYLLRFCTATMSAIIFVFASQTYGDFEFNKLTLIILIFYFMLDASVLLIAFSAINVLQTINLIRWIALFFALQSFDLSQSLMIFCGVGILLNGYYIAKFKRFNKGYNFGITILRKNVKNIAYFNITNGINIIFTRMDVLIAEFLLPEHLTLLYLFLKRVVQASLNLSLVRAKLFLIRSKKSFVNDELQFIFTILKVNLTITAVSSVVYWFYLLGQTSLVSFVFLVLAAMLTLLLSSQKAVLLNKKIHREMHFQEDMKYTLFAFTFAAPIMGLSYVLALPLLFCYARPAYEYFYVKQVKKYLDDIL